jgi:hypothetical protein
MLPQSSTPALHRSYQILQDIPYALVIRLSYRTDFLSSLHQTDSAPGQRMHDASSNAAPNHYTRPSQIIPNSAERPVRIDDAPSHTVLISFPADG